MGDVERAASIISGWKERLERGEAEAPEEVVSAHPELADELRLQFAALAGGRAGASGLRALVPDRYRDFKNVGEGGMGIVYWALDTDLNREVAFKVIRVDAETAGGQTPTAPIEITPPAKDTPASKAFKTLTARFLQEAWVTGGMSHPGIVPVYELGQTPQGVPYYTMRFVKGEQTLADAIKRAHEGGVERRIELLEPFLKVCDAIEYAHARGVIHRDLKPENVALGEFGEVVVLDWGLAKLRGRDGPVEDPWQQRIEDYRTATDMRTVAGILGTPGYLPPEAARGAVGEIDRQSDVYSLGVILFEILTGRMPFVFNTFYELMHQLIQDDPSRASEIDPEIPESLSDLCVDALARDKSERLASVADLAKRLRTWQAQRVVEQEVALLVRDARAAIAACAGLAGDALVRQVDRAQALLARIRHHQPDNEAATSIRADAERLREQGIQERERLARRRVLTRGGIAALVVAAVSAIFVSGVLNERRKEAENAERDTRVALVEAEGSTLLTESLLLAPHNPRRALELAVDGARKRPGDLAVDAIVTAIEAVRAKDGRLALPRNDLDIEGAALSARLIDATERLERGDLQGARTALEAGLVDATDARHSALIAMALVGLGRYHRAREAYPQALATFDLAHELATDSQQPGLLRRVLLHTGTTHGELGERDEAMRILRLASAGSEQEGDTPTLARTLVAMGSLLVAEDADRASARENLERALGLLQTYPDPLVDVQACVQLAFIDLYEDNAAAALARLEPLSDWFDRYERSRAALTGRLCRGQALLATGHADAALATYETVRDDAAMAGYLRLTLRARQGAARASLALGDWKRAVEFSREAVEDLPEMLRGLAFRQSFHARSIYAEVYELGLGAALTGNDPAAALYFMESGRAWTVLDTLSNRAALAETTTSPQHATDEERARAVLAQALAEMTRAREGRQLKAAREAKRRLDEARRAMAQVLARADRQRRSAAELTAPAVASLDDVRVWLGANEAFVAYGVCERTGAPGRGVIALVVTAHAERLVPLGGLDEALALTADIQPDDSGSAPDSGFAALRARLVAPLELPPGVDRVLISPAGPIAYVPGCLLFPEHETVFVSSASIQVLLAEYADVIDAPVLALGDPKYDVPSSGTAIVKRGGRLTALPGTRKEVKAIGDVVLLGEEASVSELFRVLPTRARWRAVHFACHGLLSPERPFESALALSYEEETGGFLTLHDVVRSSFPADLVALSACETARGKLFRGEGIMSWPQAFFVAGAPRILCSLWKVDDEATTALMVKFYELWSPRPDAPLDPEQVKRSAGISAAAALKQAQEHVRSHEHWRHPYYWASWVLWGLPD